MAGAALWKGVIRFGDHEVAVKLHSAVREDRVPFHLLHAPDQARLRQQMVCALEKTPVPAEEQSRGFEVEPGRYVMMAPEELERASSVGDRTIEVHEFVKSGQIDLFFRDRTYYLEPDAPEIQGKGYASLVKVLAETDAVGICTWTMRKRSYFGALQAVGKMLRLTTLRYADEVVAADSLGLQEVPLSEKELKIGSELIRQLAVEFDPMKVTNEHQAKLREIIEKKARGENIAVMAPRQLKSTEPDELLHVLEASLKKAA